MVQKTKLRVKQPSPYHSDSSRSGNHGQEENSTVRGDAHHLAVQQNCQNQGDGDGEGHFHYGILKSIDNRLPYLGIAHKLHVVVKADKDIAFSEIAGLKKTLVNGLEDRNNIQYDQTDHGRENEQPSPHEFVTFPWGSFINHNSTSLLLFGIIFPLQSSHS
jgi:hypothetical protein